jgi:UDP-glucose 4-epimerase
MNDPAWLVTGGCGFIGSRLVAALVQRGVATRIVDDLSVGTIEDLRRAAQTEIDIPSGPSLSRPRPRVAQLVKGNILDEDLMNRAAEGMTVIVHLAANTGVGPSVEDPRLDCTVNVIGTFNALEAARTANVRRFVFASSSAPIGEVEPPIHEALAPHPVSPYGASKLAGEGYCSAYARTFGIETVALRFGNVYGPGSTHKSSVVAKFIRDAMSSGTLTVNGDGNQTRDFIYIDDLIAAILLAAHKPDIGGETFQIATARETTVREIADLMCARLPIHGVARPAVVFQAPRLGDVRRNFSDTTKARTRLGWTATTALSEGIEATIQWFAEQAGPVRRS